MADEKHSLQVISNDNVHNLCGEQDHVMLSLEVNELGGVSENLSDGELEEQER